MCFQEFTKICKHLTPQQVEEGFAKFVEGEEILSTSTEPDIVKIVDRTRTLLEEVLAEHDNPSKVETLMVRSKSLYEQLLFLVEN